MPFSSGTFTRTFDCTTDRDNGVKILASKFDTEFDGIATGLSTCILKDGTQTCTAAIPFAEGLTIPDNKTIVLGTNSDITIQYDETTNDSLEIAANVEGAALGVVLKADQGDDNADQHKLNIADGGVLTLQSKISGGFVTYLTHTPNATVADSTTAVAGNLTVAGDLTLGSGAVINEAELEAIDGVTAGTVAASKAVIVDGNKDIASFRNVTLTGELDAGSLDISGDADIDGTLEADAMTLNGTAITATATLDTGISNNNVPKFTSGVADNDFLRVDGTAIEGRSASEVLSDIGGQASLTFGISNTNAVKIDSGSVADDEYARFTANGLESRATSEVLSDIGAAPAAGDSNIVTTGALNSGSITSGFGSIDNGASAITTTGTITAGGVESTCAAGDSNQALQAYHPTSTSSRTIAKFQSNVGGTQEDKVTILCDGKVGIGTATPAQLLEISGTAPIIRLTDTGASNNHSEINADYTSGSLQISADTANASSNSRIMFAVDNTEHMRIASDGKLNLGTTASDGFFQIKHNNQSDVLVVLNDTSGSGGTAVRFKVNGTTVGSISNNSSSTAFNTSSDYRLKQGVEEMTGAIDRVKALAPKRFQFTAEPDTTVDGFLAHEAQAVVPEAITGTKDEVETWTQQQIDDGDAPDGTSAGDNKLDDDGNTIPVMQGIDQSKLVPLLTGALKEAIAKIETLETKVAALEAGS